MVGHGACNDFWDEVFSEGSGPYSFGVDFSTRWPASGFVYELDVHLDPAWQAGTFFVLSASFNQPDVPYPAGLRYFATNVAAAGDKVLAHLPFERDVKRDQREWVENGLESGGRPRIPACSGTRVSA